ncbi:MAG: tetratricopeptide repeat protein, partial [Bacteroidia bacterium]
MTNKKQNRIRIIKAILCFVIFVFHFSPINAQDQKEIDSLQKALPHVNDSTKIEILKNLTNYYTYNAPKPDLNIALIYAVQLNDIAKKISNAPGQSRYYHLVGHINLQKKNYSDALDCFRQAIKIDSAHIKDVDDSMRIALDYFDMALAYSNVNDIKKVGDFALSALNILEPLWSGQRKQYFEYLHSHGVNVTMENVTKDDGIAYMKDHPGDKLFEASFNRAGSIIHRTFLTYGKLAEIFDRVKDYDNVIVYRNKQLKMARYTKNRYDEMETIARIAEATSDKKDFNSTLLYIDTLKKMCLKDTDKKYYIRVLSWEGLVYNEMGNYDQAILYFKQADDSLHGKYEGEKWNNQDRLGSAYIKQKKYNEAIKVFTGILPNAIRRHDSGMTADCYWNLGQAYSNLGESNQGINYLQKALSIYSLHLGDQNWSGWESLYQDIANAYEYKGDFKDAYINYKKYKTMEDSVNNQKDTKAAAEVQKRYEVEQKDYEIEMINKAKALQEQVAAADNRKHKIIIGSVLVGLFLVIVFSGFVLRSLRITRKQKQLIEVKNKETEEQKKVIEEKNKDILDSIMYAKRLQDAILPPLSLIKQYFPESFVLYKPKDIVAGDFYWMEKTGDTILIAAADCTGHGVPGALVSVVCSNALNRTVKEFKIIEPGKILDKVRELVLETFEKSESNVQDGMDISLASLTPSKGGIQIQWAGAFNTLWYIQ